MSRRSRRRFPRLSYGKIRTLWKIKCRGRSPSFARVCRIGHIDDELSDPEGYILPGLGDMVSLPVGATQSSISTD